MSEYFRPAIFLLLKYMDNMDTHSCIPTVAKLHFCVLMKLIYLAQSRNISLVNHKLKNNIIMMCPKEHYIINILYVIYIMKTMILEYGKLLLQGEV